ncbi:hypothetical protein EDD16DRAFT_1745599 [Pisolithus croceorrhizus]|nr:hypothetical protein EDD16DRAFT_1745599 [Pisolithus croceorrhizus]
MQKELTPLPKDFSAPDAVPRTKQTLSAGYRSGNLSLGRSAVLRDLGRIPAISLEEPEHFIYFICSLTFAKTTSSSGPPPYKDYNGKDLVYLTTRVIVDYIADALSGRKTRVFEARIESPNGTLLKDAELIVLKGTWRDYGRDYEDITFEQIFADLRKPKGPKQEEEAKKHFLTVLAAGNVMLPVHEVPKEKPIRSGEGLRPTFPFVPCSAERSKVPHRAHSRLVFKEVCQPIYELRGLDTAFETLEGVRKALEFLHSVDWVYRDVSGGNVLRWGELGKLADLEYAKRLDSNTTHKVRTGTLDFMACEVKVQKYLFTDSNALDEDFMLEEQIPLSFKFNPLHDMESIWWIATWILYYHVGEEGCQLSSDQIKCFLELFPGQLDSRTSAFLAPLTDVVLPISFHSPLVS